MAAGSAQAIGGAMNLNEAIEWLKGNRSMTNIIPQDPYHTWQVRVTQADAACTAQAYWIVKAHGQLPIKQEER
jgi:hypothetical protein